MLKRLRNCVQVILLDWRTDKANDNFKKINRMKKFITLMILSALCLGAKAQQINGDFSNWENCYPWVGGSYMTKAIGTQPVGWHASNVWGTDGSSTTGGANPNFIKQVSGHADGIIGVQIQNVFVGLGSIGSWAPGYLSLGTPWNTSKGVTEKDGGCFGGMPFNYKPDAVSFNYKYSKSYTKEASFIGYLWKGTWSQKNVPSSTTMSKWGTPKKAEIVDRDVCVLGKYDSNKHKGDTPTSTTDAKLIASYESYVESSVDAWTTCEIPFTYVDENATPEKINIVFSSSDYFDTEGAGGKSGSLGDTRDVLTIDDVKLIYYHSLISCTYNGQNVEFNAENAASVNALYDESKLAYEKKGVGATVEKDYNETGVLTITVKGNDYDADNTSVTTYTIQFATASATLAVNSAAQYGTFCAPFDVTIPAGVTAFTIGGIAENGKLTLVEQKNTILAHTPVIVYSESTTDINAVQFGVATTGNATSDYLTGVYADTKAPVGSYVLQNQSGRVGFYQVQEGTQPWVRANRAYLTVPASANVKAFYMDDATAIQTVEELLSGKAEIYDLAGRRQQKLQKGINIVGGKKVLVK